MVRRGRGQVKPHNIKVEVHATKRSSTDRESAGGRPLKREGGRGMSEGTRGKPAGQTSLRGKTTRVLESRCAQTL